MALNISQIQAVKSDEELLRLLMGELNLLFPQELRRDRVVFLSKLQVAPLGMRAMAMTFELDVSMSLDDLAWHFANHYDLDLYEETLLGLRELGAVEAADLLAEAFSIMEPYWPELGEIVDGKHPDGTHEWLDQNGIQERIDPLNKRMWKLLNQWPELGLMRYWLDYARKFPQRCVASGTE
jgi:hypothetical protein